MSEHAYNNASTALNTVFNYAQKTALDTIHDGEGDDEGEEKIHIYNYAHCCGYYAEQVCRIVIVE